MSRRAEAVLALIDAKAELDRAKQNVPDYTGQWSDEDYYEDEQKAYDAAVAEYEAAHDQDDAHDNQCIGETP